MTTSAPVWTLIGLLAAALFALVTVGLTSIRSQFDGMGRQLETMNRRIDDLKGDMNDGFSRLDRDVQALVNHVFRDR